MAGHSELLHSPLVNPAHTKAHITVHHTKTQQHPTLGSLQPVLRSIWSTRILSRVSYWPRGRTKCPRCYEMIIQNLPKPSFLSLAVENLSEMVISFSFCCKRSSVQLVLQHLLPLRKDQRRESRKRGGLRVGNKLNKDGKYCNWGMGALWKGMREIASDCKHISQWGSSFHWLCGKTLLATHLLHSSSTWLLGGDSWVMDTKFVVELPKEGPSRINPCWTEGRAWGVKGCSQESIQ